MKHFIGLANSRPTFSLAIIVFSRSFMSDSNQAKGCYYEKSELIMRLTE